jgi:2-dehydropantoate 2-reductase
MVVGELDGAVRERTRLVARCLEAVGESRVTDNVRGMIWSKLLLNTAFTGLSAVSGLRYGGVAEHPAGRTAAVGIWAEGLRVGDAEGLMLEPGLGVDPRAVTEEGDGVERLMALSANSKPSMLQDLEAGRATEVDVVNGGVAQRGRAHGIPTPLNDRVVELVHAMERDERAPSPACLDEVASVRSG